MRRLRPSLSTSSREHGVKGRMMSEPIVTVEVYDFPAQTACFSGG